MAYKDPKKRKAYNNRKSKEHYEQNKSSYILKKKLARQKVEQYIFDYTNEHACIDCGERDIRVLQFDHVRGEKKYNISQLGKYVTSIETVKKEIEKCDIVCANCHAKRTANQFNWYQKRTKKNLTSYIVYPFFDKSLESSGEK